ncbi:MAG: amidase, partial [Planctomycetales bacterium]|nr:amidase [Planctomycetales bacterium]
QGLVSVRGVLPLAFSLDHVGPMAPRVADLAVMLQALAGVDFDDPLSLAPPNSFSFNLDDTKSLAGLRIGRLTDIAVRAGDALDPDVAAGYDKALNVLKSLGATIVDVTLEGFDHNKVRSRAMLIIEADLAVIHADDLERDPGGFTPGFREGVDYGRQQSAPKLAAAFEMLREVKPVAAKLFANVDAIVTPATPCTAFSFKQPMPKTLTAFTAFANYAGAPSVSVPMGLSKAGLPMGLLFTARPWADITALRMAAAYEAAANWNLRPKGF